MIGYFLKTCFGFEFRGNQGVRSFKIKVVMLEMFNIWKTRLDLDIGNGLKRLKRKEYD